MDAIAAAQPAVTPAQATHFLPATLGGQMSLALQLFGPPTSGNTGAILHPGIFALESTYKVSAPGYEHGTPEYAEHAVRVLKAQFDTRLGELIRLTSPKDLIEKYLSEGLGTVPFQMMVGAGLLSGQVRDNFIDIVREAAAEELTGNLGGILRRAAGFSVLSRFSFFGMILTGLFTSASFFALVAGADSAVGPTLISGALFLITLFGIPAAGLKSDSILARITEASTALATIESKENRNK